MPQTKVTFYKHEVVGALITARMMRRLGFEEKEIAYVAKLVTSHMFRFHEDTSDKTIKNWMRSLGRDMWLDAIVLRQIDRKGNDKNKNKPVVTRELSHLISKCHQFIKEKKIVFYEDLKVSEVDLYNMSILKENHKRVIGQLIKAIEDSKLKNSKSEILDYIIKKDLK